MLVEAFNSIIYGVIILSLFAIDYLLGHGFVDMSQKVICKVMCFVRRVVKEEAKHAQVAPEIPISFSILAVEILVLSCTIAFLNKYKQLRGKDRIDELLNESKEALRQTNEFLEKWRLRRVPTEYSYLDDEPQEIKPLKLEVPILHMAIIDTDHLMLSNNRMDTRNSKGITSALSTFKGKGKRKGRKGTTRSKPERGDAGDTVNVTDSTLLSMTSLIDDDLESVNEPAPHVSDEKVADETKNIEFKNRYLWDVMEEDANNLED